MNIQITDQPKQCDYPGYLLGTALVNRSLHHIECVRVQYNEDSGIYEAVEGDDESNESRLDDLATVCGSRPASTVTIDGQDGEWLVYITPYSY